MSLAFCCWICQRYLIPSAQNCCVTNWECIIPIRKQNFEFHYLQQCIHNKFQFSSCLGIQMLIEVINCTTVYVIRILAFENWTIWNPILNKFRFWMLTDFKWPDFRSHWIQIPTYLFDKKIGILRFWYINVGCHYCFLFYYSLLVCTCIKIVIWYLSLGIFGNSHWNYYFKMTSL